MVEPAYCLLCGCLITTHLSLRELLWPGQVKTPLTCEKCWTSFHPINSSNCCRGCGRDGCKSSLCAECQKWDHQYGWVVENHPLYHYHGAIADYLLRYKFHGDYRLHRVFNDQISQQVATLAKQYSVSVIVPIPVTEHTLLTRGFNQVEAWLDNLPGQPAIPVRKLLAAKSWQKVDQSRKSRQERLQSAQPFKLLQPMQLTGKNVLIVDDVYTTGRTLYHAASLLKAAGARRIVSVTLAA